MLKSTAFCYNETDEEKNPQKEAEHEAAIL